MCFGIFGGCCIHIPAEENVRWCAIVVFILFDGSVRADYSINCSFACLLSHLLSMLSEVNAHFHI